MLHTLAEGEHKYFLKLYPIQRKATLWAVLEPAKGRRYEFYYLQSKPE